jgi:hypothetical protein
MAKKFLKETIEPQILVGNTGDVTRLGGGESVTYSCKIHFVCEKVKKDEKHKIDELIYQKG